MEVISILISVIALLVSLITLWLTRFRKGTIKMTKPTVIFFGPDGSGKEHNKIFIRTLLYSTSDRGQYIVETTKEKCKSESLASLSPSLAWFLLTASERQLILDYLAKVLPENTDQEVQPEQTERQLVPVKG